MYLFDFIVIAGAYPGNIRVYLYVLQDGVAMEHDSADEAGDNSTVHHSNTVNESSSTANHNRSSDHNQCVVLLC